MRVLLAREFNGTLPFVGVLEFQKMGEPICIFFSAGLSDNHGFLTRGNPSVAGKL